MGGIGLIGLDGRAVEGEVEGGASSRVAKELDGGA